MAKKGVSRITGNTSPKTGEKALYKVTEWYTSTPANERKDSLVTWELFRKRADGKFTTTDIKKKIGEFTFGKDAWQYTYRVEAYLHSPEGKEPMSIIVQPQKNEQQPSAEKNILDVKLTFQDGTPVNKKLSYQDRLWAIAKCKGMEGEHVIFTLWEDDEKGDGHNKKNQSIVKSPPVLVDSQGNARWNFTLLNTYIALANQREDDKKQHEYYITAEYNGKLKASDNANANNPEYKAPPAPPKKPAGSTGGTSQPKPAPPKPQPNSPKGSTRPNSPNNQPDKKGVITQVKLTDKNGKEFTKNPKFGETIIVHIESKNLKNKKYTLKIWEHDTIGNNDLLYSHEHTFLGDKINLSMPLTAAMQKTGEIGNDPKNPDSGEYWKGGQQEIFAEVIYIDISAKSKIIDVDIMEAPKPQNNGNTATGVKNEPKPEAPNSTKCPRCEKLTEEEVNKIFTTASKINKQALMDAFNDANKKFEINTCLRKAHFFAQVLAEVGTDLKLNEPEGFNYSVRRLKGGDYVKGTNWVKGNNNPNEGGYYSNGIKKDWKSSPFSYFKKNPKEAELYGRKDLNSYNDKGIQPANSVAIANIVYDDKNREPKYRLGNINKGDGWKFMGKGIIQITGRNNYTEVNKRLVNKGYNIDIVENPDNVLKHKESVLSAMAFWYWKDLQLKVGGKEIVDSITRIVNEATSTYNIRKENFDKTYSIFQVDKCSPIKKDEPTTGKWRFPIDNPMLCLYSQGGVEKPWHGSFGEKIRDGSSNHSGSDLLAIPGTPVYACLEGKIERIYTSTSLAGRTIVVKVKDKETFKSLKNDYKLIYKDKGELLEKGFNPDGEIYFVFMHLSRFGKFEEGQTVKHNDIIGYTGISGKNGNNFTTRNPHLHFEVNNVGSNSGINGKCNPMVYFKFKTEPEMSAVDKKNQLDIKNKEWK